MNERRPELLEQLEAHRPKKSRYEVRGIIARGGMGAIHELHDQDLRRDLAMKTLRNEFEHWLANVSALEAPQSENAQRETVELGNVIRALELGGKHIRDLRETVLDSALSQQQTQSAVTEMNQAVAQLAQAAEKVSDPTPLLKPISDCVAELAKNQTMMVSQFSALIGEAQRDRTHIQEALGEMRTMIAHNAALSVSRDVTRRDIHDRQQPFNLRVSWSNHQSVGNAGTVYDVSFIQFLQADLLDSGCIFRPAFSSATNRAWREPSWLVIDMAVGAFDALSRRFGQLGTLYWRTDASVRMRIDAPAPPSLAGHPDLDWLQN